MNETPGPGAAAVAAQLLEFFREPALYRPAWIHGEAPLPEGHVVLKFALGRFSPGWQRDLSRHDKDALVEAAHAFVRQVCLWERSSHHQVLCLRQDASADAVRENYRLLMALLHPDRQQGQESPQWPTGCAQRVNESYTVLSDPVRRREYEQALQHARPTPELAMEFPAGLRVMRSRRRAPFWRTFAVMGAVVAALFVVQAWWVTETPRHFALLERTRPLDAPAQWMRDVISDNLPRFLVPKPMAAFDPLEPLEIPKAPRRLADWVPASEAHAVAAPRIPDATTGPAPAPALVLATEVAPQRSSLPAPPADRSMPPVSPATTRTVVAQGSVPVSPAAAAPGEKTSPAAQDIELLVARLVSHYEQGDADALMGLYARGEPGFFKSFRVRGAYADFFRATRDRRLRMDRLDWQTSADAASARGEATLLADYADGSGKIERRVPVELDIAMRDGQARITRLSLYPEPK